MSPASGLVSILKKRSIFVDSDSMSVSAAHQPDKRPAKRRVRFRVPDDCYEHGWYCVFLPVVQKLIGLHMELVNYLIASELNCNIGGVNFKAKKTLYPAVCLSFSVDVGGGDSCLLLFLLCLVTVVISLGGTALYCALGDAHSSVCQDFSRNANFYLGQIQHGISQIQHWFSPGS